MTQDKASNRTSAVRTLLLSAWRERWSASQFGTQVKTVVPRGVSGDDVGLADQIIQLALNGPAPNQLLLSFLNHAVAAELVSYWSVLQSLSRFNKYSRPHCTKALLDFISKHRPYITARGGGEESVQLGTSVVSLATWIFNTAAQTLRRILDSPDSKIDVHNLSLCLELIEWVAQDRFIASLLHLGRLEDQDQNQEFNAAAKSLNKICEQMKDTAEPGQPSMKTRLTALTQKIRTMDPANAFIKDEMDNPNLVLTLQSLLSYDVLLQPTSDLSQLTGQLLVIMNIRGVSMSKLICELTRCCLLGMNDSDRFEVLRWDAFTLLKLHKLVDRLINDKSQEPAEGVVSSGLGQLLQYTALLDLTDAKCKANTFELIVKSFSSDKRDSKPLVSPTECQQLLAARLKQLEARQPIDLKASQYTENRDVTMIFKADSTLSTIIQTFQNRTTEQHEFEALLSVMFHIVKGSSFDLLLSAAAVNGTLSALVTKLLFFNKGTQESSGESNKVAQNRAALFDMTFLMLVYIVQCFSTSILPSSHQDGFFQSWARLCMTEPGDVKPLQAFKKLGGQDSFVDGLLQQINQGDIRTQVIKWNQVCSSVHDVMKEILLGVEMGTVNQDAYNRFTLQLSNKLCCFPICIASWLISTAHYGEGESSAKRPSVESVIDRFINISGGEDPDSSLYFAKRSTMMINILKKMKKELEEPLEVSTKTGKLELAAGFEKLWERVWEKRMLDIAGTKEVSRLFNAAGPQWFMEVLVNKITSQVYTEDVERCTELVFSLMHLDLVTCTLSLLLHVLPNLISGSGRRDVLCYPSGSALAKLTVSSLAAVLKMKKSLPYTTKRKLRVADLDNLCNTHTQPVKLRKLTPSTSVPVTAKPTQEQLIIQAHAGLFELLGGVGTEPSLNPKVEFLASIIYQCVQIGGEDCLNLLSPLSPDLLLHLIKLLPHRFECELLLRVFDPSVSASRRHTFTALCLLRNIQAKIRGDAAEHSEPTAA